MISEFGLGFQNLNSLVQHALPSPREGRRKARARMPPGFRKFYRRVAQYCRFLLHRSTTSTKIEQQFTKVDHKWYQSGPGGKGYPKFNKHMRRKKKRRRKELNKQNNMFLIGVRFSQNSEGSTAWRLPRFYEQSDETNVYNIAQGKAEQNRK